MLKTKLVHPACRQSSCLTDRCLSAGRPGRCSGPRAARRPAGSWRPARGSTRLGSQATAPPSRRAEQVRGVAFVLGPTMFLKVKCRLFTFNAA